MKQLYDIQMETLIGIKKGKMEVSWNQGKISGYITILGHTNPFEGVVDEEGNCRIHGDIITLMRTFHYAAAGSITVSALYLSMESGQEVFRITGASCPALKE